MSLAWIPSSSSTPYTTLICSNAAGLLASATCNSKSACRDFFERCLEAGDQMVRQIADETDRVAQQHRPPAGQLPAPRARVERGEQLVFGQHVGAGERVEQRALAGVRVADQRHRHAVVPCGDFALLAAFDHSQLARKS